MQLLELDAWNFMVSKWIQKECYIDASLPNSRPQLGMGMVCLPQTSGKERRWILPNGDGRDVLEAQWV